MKAIIFVLILCTYSLGTFAEIRPFQLTGNIKGTLGFKYAYLFDNENKLIKKVDIQNQRFVVEGTFDTEQRFGEIPIINLLLSDRDVSEDVILSDRPLSRRRYYHCTIICESKIDITYDSGNKDFSINGNEKNLLQNQFHKLDILFLTKRDSSNNSIDKMSITQNVKAELKNAEARKIYNKILAQMALLISKNPDSEVSFFNFGPILFDQQFTAAKTKELFESFSENIKRTDQWVRMKKDVDDKLAAEALLAAPAYTIGMSFPLFILQDHKEEQFNSSSISGKLTLVDFWATWCVPCRNETPNLIKAYKAYHSKGFDVITISIDDVKDKSKWIDVLKLDGMMNFINLFNGGDVSGLASKLKVITIPTNYLIDSKGKIIAMNLRGEALMKFLSSQ